MGNHTGHLPDKQMRSDMPSGHWEAGLILLDGSSRHFSLDQ